MEGVSHGGGRSEVVCSDGTRISGCMVLDATGHARKLVEYDKPFNPGYQVTSFCSAIQFSSACTNSVGTTASASFACGKFDLAQCDRHL